MAAKINSCSRNVWRTIRGDGDPWNRALLRARSKRTRAMLSASRFPDIAITVSWKLTSPA